MSHRRSHLFSCLLAGMVAACQPSEPAAPAAASTPAPAETTITPEHVASLSAGESRQAVNQLSNQVVAAETEPCNGNPEWNACVSGRMLVAFDRYGFLAVHCRDRTEYKALRDCVQFGRAGVDWVLAAGGDPDSDFDWSQPEQAHNRALGALNDALTKRCEGKPEESGNSCFTSLSAQLLGLSDLVAARCGARRKLEERGACIVDAHDAAMYGAALSALSR